MRAIYLFRRYFDDRTEGRFHIGLYSFRTIESPDLNNKVNVSCIPEGEYIVSRNTTGKHQYYGVNDVPGRTNIEIHVANKVSQLAGCIAPCFNVKDGVGYSSEEACELLLTLMGDEDFKLIIKKG